MPNANKVALIIGMDMYDSEQLHTLDCCKKDAEDLSRLVSEELGYSIFGGDATIGSELERQMGWARMRQTIGDFFSDAKPNQLLLFYFSGHGILRGDDVYLATREVDTQKPWVNGFAVSDLTKLMTISKSQQIISIIDTCYSGMAAIPNSGITSQAAKDQALAALKTCEKIWLKTQEGERRCLLLSSQPFDISLAGDPNDNSVFTKYLIEGLRGVDRNLADEYTPGSLDENGNITPISLYEFVRHKVISIVDQVPRLKCDNPREIILARYPNKVKGLKLLDNDTLFQLLRANNVLDYNRKVVNYPYVYLDFHDTDLSGANLNNAQLAMVNLNRCNLERISLEYSNLYGSTLMEANLRQADLKHARLQGTNLRNANLEECDLEYSFLDRADLQNANLKGASLKYANLTGADIQYAILTGTNLFGVKDLSISVENARSCGAIFSQI